MYMCPTKVICVEKDMNNLENSVNLFGDTLLSPFHNRKIMKTIIS